MNTGVIGFLNKNFMSVECKEPKHRLVVNCYIIASREYTAVPAVKPIYFNPQTNMIQAAGGQALTHQFTPMQSDF
ncbi:hypothetical protein BIY22_07095 [Vibrio panuliri]|uniref:Uncharacterized protein n=1 Tax=Vibrio panuliri TaxID=1381081 RepID=A0A1Q9HDY2_9VIBR|nr:hypothetical protein BIY22_07095 [Vibrio panuliri]